jgi:hypothetical protein
MTTAMTTAMSSEGAAATMASAEMAPMAEGMAVKVVTSIISAADHDIRIRTKITIVWPAIGPWISFVVIGPAIRVAAVQVSRAGAAAQQQPEEATHPQQAEAEFPARGF